jgi:predicted nuclease of restriction endonuclease-like (RecB) superfamily
MKTVSKTLRRRSLGKATRSKSSRDESAFREIISLIQVARQRAFRAVNAGLIDLYWSIGERISRRIASDGWGKSTIVSLAAYICQRDPNARGFSAQNLWRMRQFYETWRGEKKLSPLVRELSWTNNLLILGKCKRSEEREFYLRLAVREHWAKRQLERQIGSALFERVALSPAKLSPAVRVLHPQAAEVFKDSYLVEFLQLSSPHSEGDLHRGLLQYLKDFLIELGRDFCFVGSEYPIQVGGQDFSLDLLFFNRALNCLVAIDLKITRFEPEHLGKMEFYLEALDRNVRKPHERPSIGVLLCATKDDEVVEYSLSRSVSPALIAEYQTRLPDKKLLQRKLHEFYQLALPAVAATKAKQRNPRNS